eukprot:m.38123 g.38123  ORF g.38123 m.38123 type:complete len:496 (+) comp10184_c0_seq1:272-1759(+)
MLQEQMIVEGSSSIIRNTSCDFDDIVCNVVDVDADADDWWGEPKVEGKVEQIPLSEKEEEMKNKSFEADDGDEDDGEVLFMSTPSLETMERKKKGRKQFALMFQSLKSKGNNNSSGKKRLRYKNFSEVFGVNIDIINNDDDEVEDKSNGGKNEEEEEKNDLTYVSHCCDEYITACEDDEIYSNENDVDHSDRIDVIANSISTALFNKKRNNKPIRQHNSTKHKRNFDRIQLRETRRAIKFKIVRARERVTHRTGRECGVGVPSAQHSAQCGTLRGGGGGRYGFARENGRYKWVVDAHFVDVVPYNGGVNESVDTAIAQSTLTAQCIDTNTPATHQYTTQQQQRNNQQQQQAATLSSIQSSNATLSPLERLLVELQYRDATPEDYELLLVLDESVKPPTLTHEDVSANLTTCSLDDISSCSSDTANKEDSTTPSSAEESEEQQKKEQHECSICLDAITREMKLKRLPCGHFFHSDCIDAWLLEYSTTCPLDNLPVL